MKNFYLLILSGLMMMPVAASAGRQMQAGPSRTAVNRGGSEMSAKMVDTQKMKHFRLSSDDIRDPRQREAMRKEPRAAQGIAPVKKAPAEGDCTVTVTFPGEECPYFAIYNQDYFAETSYEVWDTLDDPHTYMFNVPAGTYDVFLQYYSHEEGKSGFANLVKEDVEIKGDMEIAFSEDMLTEKTVIRPMLRDGREAVLPLVTYLDAEPWIELDYTNATCDFTYLNYTLFKDGCQPLVTGYAMADCLDPEWNAETYVLSNKLSDKYHYVFQYFFKVNDDKVEISTTDLRGLDGNAVESYHDNYVVYNVPEFAKTPISEKYPVTDLKIALRGDLWYNNSTVGGGGLYMSNPSPEVYWTCQPSSADIKAPIVTTSVQGERILTETEVDEDGNEHVYTETLRAEMVEIPALYDGSEWQYINQNHSECGNFAYQRPETGGIVEYPGVPAYCYYADQMTQPVGNSAPLSVIMTQVNTWDEGETIFSFGPQAYIGRYGEVRNCDFWDLHSVVNLDGKKVFDSADGGYLEQWCVENSTDGHAKGLIEATFTNNNVQVDGDIKGFNVTTMKVDERNSDLCTPTAQMLIFKSKDGAVTDRFAKAEEGVIEFSAGDFNWVDTPEWWGYKCDEAAVKVEYAPYGSDSFAALEVEEIPENYFMPGFGYFYRGSLAGVNQPSANSWYDLRLTLTDKAGNETVQHISPAFKATEVAGVDGVVSDNLRISVIGGKVRVEGVEVSALALYAPDGRRVATASGRELDAAGFTGVGILKAIDADGRATCRKVALR